MIYFLLAIGLFSAAVALHSVARLLGTAFSTKRWNSSLGPFLNYLCIAVFGTLSVFLLMETIPVILG